MTNKTNITVDNARENTGLLLLCPKISPNYNQAIHTMVFLMLDNCKQFIWERKDSVGDFFDNNNEIINKITSFILSEYHYELSHQQVMLSIYSFMYFQTHNKC